MPAWRSDLRAHHRLAVCAALMLAASGAARAADAAPGTASSATAAGVTAPAPPATPATGTIAGAAWTIGDAAIRPASTRDELEIDLYPAHPASAAEAAGMARVLIGVPRKTGSFTVGQDATCTFVGPGSRNLVATKGAIAIDALDGTAAHGTIDCSDGAATTVHGRFTATVAAAGAP